MSAAAPVPAACSNGGKISKEAGGKYYLKADPSTVQWGYFFENVKPSLVVPSGAEVTVEMITHHAGDVRQDTHAPTTYMLTGFLRAPV